VADWLEHTVLPSAIAVAVVLLVLWPTESSGRRVLRTWGIPEPAQDQIAEAVRYLRRRRIFFTALFVFGSPLIGLVVRPDAPGVGIFVPLLGAMLIAELIATLRPVRGFRVASLDRRGWRDLVPRWAVWVMAVLVVLAVGLAVAGLTVEPPAGRYVNVDLTSRLALGYVVACLLLVVTLIHLAVRRPSVADEEVDAALRTRTARVATGIGFGWLGTAVLIASERHQEINISEPTRVEPDWFGDAMQITGPVVLAISIVCWFCVATPSRRSLARR